MTIFEHLQRERLHNQTSLLRISPHTTSLQSFYQTADVGLVTDASDNNMVRGTGHYAGHNSNPSRSTVCGNSDTRKQKRIKTNVILKYPFFTPSSSARQALRAQTLHCVYSTICIGLEAADSRFGCTMHSKKLTVYINPLAAWFPI